MDYYNIYVIKFNRVIEFRRIEAADYKYAREQFANACQRHLNYEPEDDQTIANNFEATVTVQFELDI